jgi:hypothetical protein
MTVDRGWSEYGFAPRASTGRRWYSGIFLPRLDIWQTLKSTRSRYVWPQR